MLELKGDLYEDDGENANAISCYSEALRVEIYFTRPFWKLFNQHLVPPSKSKNVFIIITYWRGVLELLVRCLW